MRDLLRRFAHWWRCGGGYSTYQHETGESRCGFCDFCYASQPQEVRRG